MIVGTSVLVL
ncbi:unnamed protein product, partial [Rotaria magnacalcarata]